MNIHKNTHQYIITELARYVQAFVDNHEKQWKRIGASEALTPMLRYHAFQGEALIRLQFAQFYKKLFNPTSINDSDHADFQPIYLFEKIVHNEGLIFNLLAQSGLFTALSKQCKMPVPTPSLAWQIYAALIFNLHHEKKHSLIKRIGDDWWRWQYLQLFPEKAKIALRETPTAMRQKLQKLMQKHYKKPVEIVEKFSTHDALAKFQIRYRFIVGAGQYEAWQAFPEHSGTRLKPLKLTAYQQAIENINNDVEGCRLG